jgi:hypothetical protein
MILPLFTVALFAFLYRKTVYCRIEPRLSIIIFKNNNGYTLITYSNRFTFDAYDTLEELWVGLITIHRIYYFIDAVDSKSVIDKLMRKLQLFDIDKIFHYQVYWENQSLVRYMLKKNILLHYPTYPHIHTLIADQKWGCFDLVTTLMFDEFDTIFDKINPDSYSCVLELGRRLKESYKLFYNPKIKSYLEQYNTETMKRLVPFMEQERLPQDINHLVASYLLY